MMSEEFKETKRPKPAESSRGDSKLSQEQHRAAASDDSAMDFRTMGLEPFSASAQRLFTPHLETKTPKKEIKEELEDFDGPTFIKFHDLPKELGRRVFDNFAPQELSQFAVVSKHFPTVFHKTVAIRKRPNYRR